MTKPAALPHVHVVLHKRITPPLLGPEAELAARIDWLADEACRQLRRALAAMNRPRCLNFVCSTSLSKVFSSRPQHVQKLLDRLQAHGGVSGAGLLQAYQCAAWGWALRFAATRSDKRFLVLSIVDADLHELWDAGFEPMIGKLGYGVSTVGLELPPGMALPRCEGPFANRGFTDLLHAVRARHKQFGRTPTFLPFLTEGLAAIAQRTIGADVLAPNKHARYGHVFGADPWIGLIEWLQAQPVSGPTPVTLGAFAYDGYFTLADLEVGPQTLVELHEADVPAEALA